MLKLDHLAVAAETLEDGRSWVENALGVPMQDGGQHAHFGTHNALLGLGDIYLEVITLDPSAQRARPAWFGLDTFSGPPRPANWICQAPLDFAPEVTGPPIALERGDLRWQLTVPDDGHLPMEAGFPSIIQWGDMAQHPAGKLVDVGCRLAALTVCHPQADWLQDRLRLDDPRVGFEAADAPRLVFEIDTPDGRKVLG